MNALETLEHIKNKYNLDFSQKMPITLPVDRRHKLPELMNELNFKSGAEIGVSKGRYAKWLFNGMKDLKLYCVDPWIVYDDYIELHNKEYQSIYDGLFEETKERLKGKNVEFIRKFSIDAVKDFANDSLDFVFIDGNHTFQYVINDIAEWSKKVRPGGIISGHDFWNSVNERNVSVLNLSPIEKMKLCQVKDAIYAWTHTNKITTWFITSGDSCPSWLWIKE